MFFSVYMIIETIDISDAIFLMLSATELKQFEIVTFLC